MAVVFGRPRRTGDDYFVRASKARDLQLSAVRVCEVKHIDDLTLLTLRPAGHDRRRIAALERDVKQVVRENISEWFRDSVSASIIDEYFLNGIVLDDEHGMVFKARVADMPADAVAAGRMYDMTLRIRGILFRPTTYHIEFASTDMRPATAILDDDGGQAGSPAYATDDDDDIIPPDEICTIRGDIERKVRAGQERLVKLSQRVEEARQRLSQVELDTLRGIDMAADIVDQVLDISV